MITRLDRAVTRYLVTLNSRPATRSEPGLCAWLDRCDRARFGVLDLLIRKPRYRGVQARAAWKSKANPHRPPLA